MKWILVVVVKNSCFPLSHRQNEATNLRSSFDFVTRSCPIVKATQMKGQLAI